MPSGLDGHQRRGAEILLGQMHRRAIDDLVIPGFPRNLRELDQRLLGIALVDQQELPRHRPIGHARMARIALGLHLGRSVARRMIELRGGDVVLDVGDRLQQQGVEPRADGRLLLDRLRNQAVDVGLDVAALPVGHEHVAYPRSDLPGRQRGRGVVEQL